MADDRSKRSPVAPGGNKLKEPYDIAWLTQKFGVSEQQLREAVKKSGISTADIDKLLKH